MSNTYCGTTSKDETLCKHKDYLEDCEICKKC